MSKEPLVDEKSLELARHFLSGGRSADDEWNLAAAIQTAVEDWFETREHAVSCEAMGAETSDE